MYNTRLIKICILSLLLFLIIIIFYKSCVHVGIVTRIRAGLGLPRATSHHHNRCSMTTSCCYGVLRKFHYHRNCPLICLSVCLSPFLSLSLSVWLGPNENERRMFVPKAYVHTYNSNAGKFAHSQIGTSCLPVTSSS